MIQNDDTKRKNALVSARAPRSSSVVAKVAKVSHMSAGGSKPLNGKIPVHMGNFGSFTRKKNAIVET